MKKFLLGIAFFCAFILTSCSYNTGCYSSSSPCSSVDFTKENWLCKINVNSDRWIQNADPWFLTGQANAIECADLHAPYAKGITKMMVRVPDDFTHIKVRGGFQVQIIGGQSHNSVFVLGPNAGARRVAVETRNHTLYVYETKPTGQPCGPNESVRDVIVRINVKTLHSLSNLGCGTLYGRDIFSKKLILNAAGGNMMLVGKMNLVAVNQTRSGNVTVIGAITPSLKINAFGRGNINISGRIGIQSIINCGSAFIRIIGADTNSLVINAGGNSKTTIVGYVNLKTLRASGNSCVYLYWVNACDTYITLQDNARVGVAGIVQNLYLDVQGRSYFWGGYLRNNVAYARTRNYAHANVFASEKLFVDAENESSLYYYGSPINVSKFSENRAVVLSMAPSNCAPGCALPAGCPTTRQPVTFK
jgi:hypothetical protein